MIDEFNSYEILGVPCDASDAEIIAAYRRLAKQSHSDLGGTDGLFRLVENAKEELLDPERRAELDRSLGNPYNVRGDASDFSDDEEDDQEAPQEEASATWQRSEQANEPAPKSLVAISVERIISWIVWLVEAWLSSNTSYTPKSFVQTKKSPLPRRLRVIIWIIVVWLFLAAEYTSIANLLSGGLDFAPIIFWNLIFAALFMLYRHHHKAEKSGGVR